jgi:hypothetical protein
VSYLRLRSTFVGYHSDMLGSLIMAVENRHKAALKGNERGAPAPSSQVRWGW